LQPSDNRELLRTAVEHELRELETLCGNIERALMMRRWNELDAAIGDSRRVTHALQNAMDDAQAVRDDAFDEGVYRRLHYVDTIRRNQMARLQQYHDAVAERLQVLARWKSALRSIGKPGRGRASRLGTLDRLT
jgi:hypothetical protein